MQSDDHETGENKIRVRNKIKFISNNYKFFLFWKILSIYTFLAKINFFKFSLQDVKVYNDSENTGINDDKNPIKNTLNNDRLNTFEKDSKSRDTSENKENKQIKDVIEDNENNVSYKRKPFPKPKRNSPIPYDLEENKIITEEKYDVPPRHSEHEAISSRNIKSIITNPPTNRLSIPFSKAQAPPEESVISDKIPSDNNRFKSRMTYTSRKSFSENLNEYLDSESIRSKTSSLKRDVSISVVDSKENGVTNKIPVSFYNLMRKKHSVPEKIRNDKGESLEVENKDHKVAYTYSANQANQSAFPFNRNNILSTPKREDYGSNVSNVNERSYFRDDSRILNENDVNFNIQLDMEENKK